MSKALRVPDYLGHILQAMERIDRYTAGLDELGFLGNELVQDAVIRNIEVIGEASNNIQRADSVFAARHSDIPWQVMYTMRNRVSHGYDTIDLEIVWQTIQHPDGHPKLLHCWPVKLLQAGRGDYAGSEVMIRRAAASLSL